MQTLIPHLLAPFACLGEPSLYSLLRKLLFRKAKGHGRHQASRRLRRKSHPYFVIPGGQGSPFQRMQKGRAIMSLGTVESSSSAFLKSSRKCSFATEGPAFLWVYVTSKADHCKNNAGNGRVQGSRGSCGKSALGGKWVKRKSRCFAIMLQLFNSEITKERLCVCVLPCGFTCHVPRLGLAISSCRLLNMSSVLRLDLLNATYLAPKAGALWLIAEG